MLSSYLDDAAFSCCKFKEWFGAGADDLLDAVRPDLPIRPHGHDFFGLLAISTRQRHLLAVRQYYLRLTVAALVKSVLSKLLHAVKNIFRRGAINGVIDAA